MRSPAIAMKSPSRSIAVAITLGLALIAAAPGLSLRPELRLSAPTAEGKVTQLKDAPCIIRISSTVTAIDPVSGDLLVLSSEDKGKFHALDVKKNAWRQLPDAPISEGASVPIEAHGVIMYFANRPTKVYLYKHVK